MRPSLTDTAFRKIAIRSEHSPVTLESGRTGSPQSLVIFTDAAESAAFTLAESLDVMEVLPFAIGHTFRTDPAGTTTQRRR